MIVFILFMAISVLQGGVQIMKYRDYLILPVLVMFLVYASCAYVGDTKAASAENESAVVSVMDDREVLLSQIQSCRFVNEEDARDYFVLKTNGRIVQYCGDRVFKGKWDLTSPEALTLHAGRNSQGVTVEFLFDGYGSICGAVCNDVVYALSA